MILSYLKKLKIIETRKITKVLIGRKRRLKRIIVVIGNKIDTISFGIGRNIYAQQALKNATKNALHNLITLPITKNFTLNKLIYSSYNNASILIKPIKYGLGIKCDRKIRPLFDYVGIKNISCKLLGAHNILNNIKAIMKGFLSLLN